MNYIEIVDKYDDSFQNFNRRLLELDNGMLKYYSKVPKNYNASVQLTEAPKAGYISEYNLSLLIEHILGISEDDAKVPQNLRSRTIALTFYRGMLLSGKELLEPVQRQAKSKDIELQWVFLFESEEKQQRWAENLSQALIRLPQPSQSVRKFVEAHNKQVVQEEKRRLETVQDTTVQGFQQGDEEDKKNEAKKLKFEQLKNERKIQEINKKQEEQEQQREKRLQQEEEQRRLVMQKEEEDRRKREEENKQARREQERLMKQKIQTAWEFRYYQSQEDCLDAMDHFEDKMKTGLKMIKFIETFREEAFNTVQDIICDLLDKQVRKTNLNQQMVAEEEDILDSKKTIFTKVKQKQKQEQVQEYVESIIDCYDGTFVFNKNNMIISIAAPHTQEKTLSISIKSNLFKIIDKKHEYNLLNDHAYYRSIFHSNAKKRKLSDEFKALNYLNDICYSLKSVDKNFRLKVPLACIIEYMGFKALVIAQPPSSLDESSLAYGALSDKSYKSSGKLDREVEALGRTLAIKPHFFTWKASEVRRITIIEGKKTGIYLSVFTEIHVGKFDEFEQLKSLLRAYSDQEIDMLEIRRQGIFYLRNCQDLLPNVIEESYADLVEQLNQSRLQSELDYPEEPIQEYEFRRCRPEFLQVYFDTGNSGQLKVQQNNLNKKLYNPDAYDTAEESNEIFQDQLVLAEMSKYYTKQYIIEFVAKLDQLEICPIDSHSLRECFRLFGINIRHLGVVAGQTQVPHIQQLCEQEMLARSIKNIFNQQYTEFLQSIQEDQIPLKTTELKKQSFMKDFSSDSGELDMRRGNKKLSVMMPSRTVQERMSIKDYIDYQYREMLADVLNLVFSKSTLFYEQILFKQVMHDYNYDIQCVINGISPGGLLSAISYNLKVDIDFEPSELFSSTPYPLQDQENAINKYNLRQYSHVKSYQVYFKQTMQQTQQSVGQTPTPTPPTKGTRQMKTLKKGLFDIHSFSRMHYDVDSYNMQEVEICKLINKYNVFKQQNNYQLAMKVLYIRLNLITGMDHSSQVQLIKCHILTDIAQLHNLLKQGQQCIIKIAQALHEVNKQVVVPQHQDINNNCATFLNNLSNATIRLLPRPGMVRPLMVLLEAAIEWFPDYTFDIFDLLLFNLEFTYGTQHHYYAKLFYVMATYFSKIGKLEDVSNMHQMQVMCLIQTLGQQHQMTAEAYVQIGDTKQCEDSILYYEKAFFIYESIYTDQSIQAAHVSCKLATAYSKCGRIGDVLKISTVAIKILKSRLTENIYEVLDLQYLRSYNFLRNLQRDVARKECEEYFNILLTNKELLSDGDCDVQFGDQKDIYNIPQALVDMAANVCRVYIEIFLHEVQKEHRILLYQLFDTVVESFARSNRLEQVDNGVNNSLNTVLKKIRQYSSVQTFLESILLGFIDKTGGDSNSLVFNFKQQSSELFRDALENYENMIIVCGRKQLLRVFERVLLAQQ